MVRRAAPLLIGLLTSAAMAAEAPPFPNPLSLEQALVHADDDHPDLALAQARLGLARARAIEVDARTGVRAYADLTPEWADPTTPGEDSVNDSRARVIVSKPLYDFGRQSAYRDSAAAGVASSELAVLDARARRRLAIMERFFDVLLADQHYAVLNEEMAQRYVAFDRIRERHSLGQISEVDLAAAENHYREALDARTDAEKRRVATRSQLALALGRRDALPAELAEPALPALTREIPEPHAVYAQALAASPRVQALKQDLDAARRALTAERARRRPVLSAEFEAAEYRRALASRNDLRATLNLRLPLYQGGEVDAALALAAGEVAVREARLQQLEHELKQAVLDLVQQLEALKVKRDTARRRVAYRDLYLDRSRALYELEVRTDLGDALTRLTEAQWLAAKADYEMALTWARLDALTGTLVAPAEEVRP